MKNLESGIALIEARNRRVEIGKAWESSLFRKISIICLTYIFMVFVFYFLNLGKPLINAIIPTLGFTISTFSLDFLKKYWLENIYKKKT